MEQTNNREKDIEELFRDLDETLQQLEKKETSLEDSFRLYQKGVLLLKECGEKIDAVEKKMLLMNGDGTFREF